MKEIIPYDVDGNKVTTLVQWDKDVMLKFRDAVFTGGHPVHFFNRSSDQALVVESQYESGILSAKIPNKLLRERYTLVGYVDIIDANGERCLYGFKIRILPKPKPSDIVYIESIDYVNLVSISEECRSYASAAATAQRLAEDAQSAAETAQATAATAQGKAEDAQSAAETAQQKAEVAQGKAEDAQSAAETAQSAAEAAQGKAEDAQSAAETAEGNAATSETNAATSASNAAQSATAAGIAQTAAEDAQSAAETAQSAAEAAQGRAEDAQSAAAISAADAANSAVSAATAKTAAADSATDAGASEANAASSASRSESAATRAEAAAAAAKSYSSGAGIVEIDITVPVSAWTQRQADGGPDSVYSVTANVYNTDVLAKHVPVITLGTASFDAARKAELFPCASTFDGGLKLWAVNVPSQSVSAHVVLLSNNNT